MRRWVAEVRGAVEAAPRPQADEDLAPAPLQTPLQLDGVLARVEDEQGSDYLLGRPEKERLDLLDGHLVGVLRGADAHHVHGGAPALAGEAQLCDELVGPACDDGLTGGVAGRMVVVAALGARLGLTACPHARVYGKDRRLPYGVRASGWRARSLRRASSSIRPRFNAA